MLEGLKAMAGPTVSFWAGWILEQLRELYAGAKAVLYPAEDEDFGIVPIEAMAFGTPAWRITLADRLKPLRWCHRRTV
jgi:glycosyltransferase involved in cell wall biosynthesis